jgi:hypothetical protein
MFATSRLTMKPKLQWESILSTHKHVAPLHNRAFAKAVPLLNTGIHFFMK